MTFIPSLKAFCLTFNAWISTECFNSNSAPLFILYVYRWNMSKFRTFQLKFSTKQCRYGLSTICKASIKSTNELFGMTHGCFLPKDTVQSFQSTFQFPSIVAFVMLRQSSLSLFTYKTFLTCYFFIFIDISWYWFRYPFFFMVYLSGISI